MKPDYALKPAMKKMQIESLRKEQIKPIQSILKGHDTIVSAPTSMGKSLIYQLPALVHGHQLTLVIEPTLALIYDQVKKLQALGISADYLDHTRSKPEEISVFDALSKGQLTFLYVTPERLQSRRFQAALSMCDLYMIVIDECHCITEWGYTFRDAYLQIGHFIEKLPRKPIVFACSATIQEYTVEDLSDKLHLDSPKWFRCDLTRKNLILIKKDLTMEDRSLENRLYSRFKAVKKVVRKYQGTGSVVIYASTIDYVDALYDYLSEYFPGQVVRNHSKMRPHKKEKMLLDFLTGQRKIMVATTAFGMGVDVHDIELILHFNVPLSIVDYVQQIGRGGRDGRKCHCVLFYEQNGDDQKIFASFYKKSQNSKMLKQRYQEMQDFVHSKGCMQQEILAYFGQTAQKTCQKCTNCAKERRK